MVLNGRHAIWGRFWTVLSVFRLQSVFLCFFFKIGLVAVHALEKSNQRVPVSNNFPPSEKLCRSLFSFWELIEKRTKCQDAIISPSQQTFILLWRRFWMESRRAKALKEIPSHSRTKYHGRAELKYNLIAFATCIWNAWTWINDKARIFPTEIEGRSLRSWTDHS